MKNKKFSGLKKYGQNTIWLLSEKVIKMILGVFVGVWVARYLGPEDFGKLSFALSVFTLISGISTLGLDSIISKEFVNKKEKIGVIMGTSITLRLMSSLTILLIIFGYVFFRKQLTDIDYLILILSIGLIFQSFSVLDVYFVSQVRGKFSALARMIATSLVSMVKIILIITAAQVSYFALAFSLEFVFLSISLLTFYFYNKLHLSWSYSSKEAISLLKNSWPLLFNGIVVTAYMKLDQIMIKNIMDYDSVGIYSAATRLSEVWYFIPVVISSAIFPAIVNAKKISDEKYYSRLKILYAAYAWLAIIIAVLITMTSHYLIDILYGVEYFESIKILNIHIWTGVFVFLGVARSGWIINENLQRYSLLYLIFSLLLNITLNMVFIPEFGLEGAAYATLISQVFSLLIAPLFFKKTWKASFMALQAIVFLPSIIMLTKKLILGNYNDDR